MRAAARHDNCAFGYSVLHMLIDLPECCVIDKWALVDVLLKRVANAELANSKSQAPSELCIDARLHEEAIHADACLARIPEFRCHGALHCSVQIGVVEYDKRRIAAEFQRKLLQCISGLSCQKFADSRRA